MIQSILWELMPNFCAKHGKLVQILVYRATSYRWLTTNRQKVGGNEPIGSLFYSYIDKITTNNHVFGLLVFLGNEESER